MKHTFACGLLMLAALNAAQAARILDGEIAISASGSAHGYLLGQHGTIGFALLDMHTVDNHAQCWGLPFNGCVLGTRFDADKALIDYRVYEGGQISLDPTQNGWTIHFADFSMVGWTGDFVSIKIPFTYQLPGAVFRRSVDGRLKTLFNTPATNNGVGVAHITFEAFDGGYEFASAKLDFDHIATLSTQELDTMETTQVYGLNEGLAAAALFRRRKRRKA